MRSCLRVGSIIALAAALAAFPAGAEAHTLSKGRAVNQARNALWNYAERSARWWEEVDKVQVRWRDCVRIHNHRFDCVGSADYYPIEGYEYDDGTDVAYCVYDITLRYVSSYSRRVAQRVYGEKCF